MLRRDIENRRMSSKRSEESNSLFREKTKELRSRTVNLRGFTIVFGDESAELPLTLDHSPTLWDEGFVENRVIHCASQIFVRIGIIELMALCLGCETNSVLPPNVYEPWLGLRCAALKEADP